MNCFFEEFELGFLLIALDGTIAELKESLREHEIRQSYQKLRSKVAKYLKESET